MSYSLQRLGKKHRTDKATEHNYCRVVYPYYLESWRAETFHLLEIGIKRGCSLRMWRDYFPNAKVSGIDKKIHIAPEKGLNLFQGRQEDTKFLASVLQEAGPPDVVIDDGGHQYEDQKASFEFLFPNINSDGLYFIEDLRGADKIAKYLTTIAHSRTTSKQERTVKFVHFWHKIIVVGKH